MQKNFFGVLCATSSIEDGIVISITFFPFLYWPSPVYIDHRQLFVHIFEIPGFAKDFYIHSTLSDLDYIDFYDDELWYFLFLSFWAQATGKDDFTYFLNKFPSYYWHTVSNEQWGEGNIAHNIRDMLNIRPSPIFPLWRTQFFIIMFREAFKTNFRKKLGLTPTPPPRTLGFQKEKRKKGYFEF